MRRGSINLGWDGSEISWCLGKAGDHLHVCLLLCLIAKDDSQVYNKL